jgi:hypothetical protein
VEIAVSVTAMRYVINESTGQRTAGNPEIRHCMDLVWTLQPTEATANPWQLIETTDPAAAIPGV